jgi:hypothetical protein
MDSVRANNVGSVDFKRPALGAFDCATHGVFSFRKSRKRASSLNFDAEFVEVALEDFFRLSLRQDKNVRELRVEFMRIGSKRLLQVRAKFDAGEV